MLFKVLKFALSTRLKAHIFKRQILALENWDDIEITDSILTNQLTFQSYSPSAEQMENGTILVHTYSHMTYDLDPLDFNNHLSAK